MAPLLSSVVTLDPHYSYFTSDHNSTTGLKRTQSGDFSRKHAIQEYPTTQAATTLEEATARARDFFQPRRIYDTQKREHLRTAASPHPRKKLRCQSHLAWSGNGTNLFAPAFAPTADFILSKASDLAFAADRAAESL